VRSFLNNTDKRRELYLKLSGSVESQLRDAYAKLHDAGLENQTTIAKKLRVGRSVINRRLSGHANLTLETIADMLWALDHDIYVEIFDPVSRQGHRVVHEHSTSASDQLNMVKSGYGLVGVSAPEVKAEAV
jgi:hypothetical protein